MTFISALSFWWLAPILGGIFLLYLMKMKRVDMRVPAVFLWPKLTSDVRANAPFQRLRFSWLLVIQIVIVCLIVTALTGPLRRMKGLSGAATIVLLDHSTSMNSTDVAPSRYLSAVSKVRALIGSMSAGDRLALIEAGASTRIVFPLTGDKTQMERAMDHLESSDAPSNMGEALRLAAQLAQDRPKARIVVLSDGAFPPVQDFSPGKSEIVFEPIGTSHKNVAVTAFESTLTPGGATQCFASIHNYDSSPAQVTLLYKLDGALADARRFTAPAGQSTPEVFSVPSGAKRADVAISAPGDILEADNHATIFLKTAGSIRTLLVSNGDLFLERALSLNPAIRLEQASSVPESELASSPGDGLYDLVIFDNVAPVPVKSHAVCSFGAPAAQFGVNVVGTAQQPKVLDWRHDHPVMQYADFRDVAISKSQQVRLVNGSGARSLVDSDKGALVVARSTPSARFLYTSFNILDSDFPLRVAFPIFIANSVSWLTTGADRASSEKNGIMSHPGKTFSVALTGNSAVMTSPDGSKTALQIQNGAVVVHNANQVGVYEISSSKSKITVAENILDEQTSDIRPQSSLNVGSSIVAATKTQMFALSEFWRPIALAALLLLALEWWIFVRRS